MRRKYFQRPLRFIALLLLAGPLGVAARAEDKLRPLPDDAGKYVLSLPNNYDPKKEYELIVALHGSGDPPEHFVKALRSLMPAREFILAAPYSRDLMEWDSDELPVVEATLADVKKTCRIKTDRVLLLGFSAGGGFGFYFVAQKPELFSGFASFAQTNNAVPEDDLAAAKDLPIFYSVGKRDKYSKPSEESAARLKKLGFTFEYDTPADIGHTLTPEQLKRMFAWFDGVFKKRAEAKAEDSEDAVIGLRKR